MANEALRKYIATIMQGQQPDPITTTAATIAQQPQRQGNLGSTWANLGYRGETSKPSFAGGLRSLAGGFATGRQMRQQGQQTQALRELMSEGDFLDNMEISEFNPATGEISFKMKPDLGGLMQEGEMPGGAYLKSIDEEGKRKWGFVNPNEQRMQTGQKAKEALGGTQAKAQLYQRQVLPKLREKGIEGETPMMTRIRMQAAREAGKAGYKEAPTLFKTPEEEKITLSQARQIISLADDPLKGESFKKNNPEIIEKARQRLKEIGSKGVKTSKEEQRAINILQNKGYSTEEAKELLGI